MSETEKKPTGEANESEAKATGTSTAGTSAASPGEEAARAAAAEGPASDTKEAAVVEDQLQATRDERDRFKEKWLRSEADHENYRKRTQKEREQDAQFRSLYLAKDLLGPLDNLHRTLEAADKGTDLSKLLEGVRMVTKQFDDVLTRHSVVPMNPVGKPFDPNLHQAIQQVPSADHEPMTVVAEFERGYTLHDRVVRPSSVVVSCAPPEKTPE